MAVDGNGGPMQPLDDQAPPALGEMAAPAAGSPTAAGSPVAENPVAASAVKSSGKGPAAIAMAAFQRVPVKWLAIAGGVIVLLVIGIGAVALLGGPFGSSPSPGPVQAVPGTGPGAAPSGPDPAAPASPGAASTSGPGAPTAPGTGAAPGGNQPGSPAAPPASVEALRALLIPAPGSDSTVDTEPIDDTTFEGARWGVTLFWAEPEGSMVLAQYATPEQARTALAQYRESVHDSGICDEQAVPGRADAFLCAAKGLGEGVDPGDIPAIGLGVKGTVIALVTAADPANVQQLLTRQLDQLP